MKKKINHIVINAGEEGGGAYTLFENIQNGFRLYDNCVIEEAKDGPFIIRIEGSVLDEIMELAQKILSRGYITKLEIQIVPKSDTIFDENDRKDETGGLTV